METTTFTAAHRGGSGPPLLLLHGFTDTWRTWELTLPALERRHEVLAPTLAGHAGGPPLDGEASDDALVDAVERALDAAGWERAHVVGNSLGGWVALQLAARGRARSVLALAPAGGWPAGDPAYDHALAFFAAMRELLPAAAPRADEIVSTPEGRRRATLMATERFEHIPAELLAHQIRGAAACAAAGPLIERSREHGWALDARRIECPVQIAWGVQDRLLVLPAAARRFREEWLPDAEWTELEGVGHCPQLDVPERTAELILEFSARSASPARAG